MHLLITILQDVCEHELVCNTPMIVCHQDLKRIISAALCARSFDFDINHCSIYKQKDIFTKQRVHLVLLYE